MQHLVKVLLCGLIATHMLSGVYAAQQAPDTKSSNNKGDDKDVKSASIQNPTTVISGLSIVSSTDQQPTSTDGEKIYDEEVTYQIFQAIGKREVSSVAKLIKCITNPNLPLGRMQLLGRAMSQAIASKNDPDKYMMDIDIVSTILQHPKINVNKEQWFLLYDSNKEPYFATSFPLHVAYKLDMILLITLLDSPQTNPNQFTIDGKTLLHIVASQEMSCENTRYYVLELLIQRGADRSVKDTEGHTAYTWVKAIADNSVPYYDNNERYHDCYHRWHGHENYEKVRKLIKPDDAKK